MSKIANDGLTPSCLAQNAL